MPVILHLLTPAAYSWNILLSSEKYQSPEVKSCSSHISLGLAFSFSPIHIHKTFTSKKKTTYDFIFTIVQWLGVLLGMDWHPEFKY